MRVIGGSAGGRRLKSPKGRGTRPTTDRVKAATFSILESEGINLGRVLDLYAGTGSLGIEALSRGAGRCDFVEQDFGACAIIKDNLKLTQLQDRGRVHCMPVAKVVERLEGPYDLVLMDPPFDDERAIQVLRRLAESPLMGPQSTIVFEHSRRQRLPERCGAFAMIDERHYGDSHVAFYRYSPES